MIIFFKIQLLIFVTLTLNRRNVIRLENKYSLHHLLVR